MIGVAHLCAVKAEHLLERGLLQYEGHAAREVLRVDSRYQVLAFGARVFVIGLIAPFLWFAILQPENCRRCVGG